MTSEQVRVEAGLAAPFNMRDPQILKMAGDASLGDLHHSDLYGKSSPLSWALFGPCILNAYPGGGTLNTTRVIQGAGATAHKVRFVPTINSSKYRYSGNESGNNFNPQAQIDILLNGSEMNNLFGSATPPTVGWSNPNPVPGPPQWDWTVAANVVQGDQITIRLTGQAYDSELDVTINVYDDFENGYLLESIHCQVHWN